MHFERIQRELWLVATLALTMGLTKVDAQMEQLIGPAMQHMAQMSQMMQGGMEGAVQSLGGPEGLMKIGMAVAQGFMQGAAASGGRSGLPDDAELSSRSGLDFDEPDGPYSLPVSRAVIHEHHDAPDYYTEEDAGHKESLDYWRSARDRWLELSGRTGIDGPRFGGSRRNSNNVVRKPSWLTDRSGLVRPVDYSEIRRLHINDDDEAYENEPELPRRRSSRRDRSWQRRFRRLADVRSSGVAGDRGEPVIVSPKHMLGSPYEIKDQAAFPTSSSMKRGRGGRSATVLVSHND